MEALDKLLAASPLTLVAVALVLLVWEFIRTRRAASAEPGGRQDHITANLAMIREHDIPMPENWVRQAREISRHELANAATLVVNVVLTESSPQSIDHYRRVVAEKVLAAFHSWRRTS